MFFFILKKNHIFWPFLSSPRFSDACCRFFFFDRNGGGVWCRLPPHLPPREGAQLLPAVLRANKQLLAKHLEEGSMLPTTQLWGVGDVRSNSLGPQRASKQGRCLGLPELDLECYIIGEVPDLLEGGYQGVHNDAHWRIPPLPDNLQRAALLPVSAVSARAAGDGHAVAAVRHVVPSRGEYPGHGGCVTGQQHRCCTCLRCWCAAWECAWLSKHAG